MFGPEIFYLIPFTAIVCTFIFLMRVVNLRHMRYRHAATQASELDELKAQIAAFERTAAGLEDRIRVLERIVTDDATTLRREIDRLRA